MSNRFVTDPPRWSDPNAGTPGPKEVQEHSQEQRIGAQLRRVKKATDPAAGAVRLRAAGGNNVSSTARLRWTWRLAVAAVLIMAMATAVGAALATWQKVDVGTLLGLHRNLGPAGAPQSPARAKIRRANAESRSQSDSAATVGSSPAERPGSPDVAARVTTSPSTAIPARPSATSANGEVTHREIGEADTLARVFRELRSGADPTRVLRSLDRYDRRFPGAILQAEARIARAEALLALGHRGEALALLEQLETAGGALTPDVRVTRGELRAETAQCRTAVADFDAVLERARPTAIPSMDAITARALFGRASCRLRDGDVTGGRADLQRYQLLYPHGPMASAARTALDALP